jgi:hypothetical protein
MINLFIACPEKVNMIPGKPGWLSVNENHPSA